MNISRKRYRHLRFARIGSQTACLVLFFFLFIKTDYTGSDTIEYAVNIFFRIDPLLAFSTMLAMRAVIALMLPALFIVLLSLLFGRAFCGWLCPLGSLIDFLHPVLKPLKRSRPTRYPHLAKIMLVFLLITSFLGLPLAGYLDPFSILVRGLVQALYPGINNVAVAFFTFTYDQAPAAVNMVTEPVYSLLKYSVLPFEQKYYELGLVSFFVLASVFLAEFFQRRFFCRNVCPLGALLGWFARVGVLHISGGDDACGKCRHCIKICRMGAIDENRLINSESCIICIECLEQCPRQVISFAGSTPLSQGVGLSLSRRQFLASLSAGVLLPPVLSVRTLKSHPDPLVIRPPGARAEREFLQRCVRCAECIQVCIGNALQPALLQSGIEGIFSPRLVARAGYCEFNCTLCGQVCPTSAIRTLTLAEKHITKIGHAWFDKNLCLPYAKGIPCIVCEEHCPTPDKAIKFRIAEVVDDRGASIKVKQPYIVDDLCIGCGICETRCPLPGRSAVYITSAGEHRNSENSLPVLSDKTPGGSYGNYQ